MTGDEPMSCTTAECDGMVVYQTRVNDFTFRWCAECLPFFLSLHQRWHGPFIGEVTVILPPGHENTLRSSPRPLEFLGGPARKVLAMIKATADLRDLGGLPAITSLVFSQVLLNLIGHTGRKRADALIAAFWDACDPPPERTLQ